MPKKADPGGSRSVERALSLVRALAVASDGLSLTRAAQEVDLPTSTVARLLRSLEASGFAVRDGRSIYRPGVAVLQMGAIALDRLDLASVAVDHLRELADFTGETAYLAIPDGPDAAVYLRQVESPRAIRHATWTGRSISTSGTALGAALALRVNEGGFAVSRATAIEPEAAAAAAPITDKNGRAIGAISIIGPSFRLNDDVLAGFGTSVAEHARAIAATMQLSTG